MPKATYRLCPRCHRAVSSSTGERYCINDGERLLTRCGRCHTAILSPYAEYCPQCGGRYGSALAPLPATTAPPHPKEDTP